MLKYFFPAIFFLSACNGISQTPLFIPPALSGSEFNLEVQNGTTEFFPGINTPTYGINGPILGPTLILEKWSHVTMHVTNHLIGSGNSTTMHWHGLHVPAIADGGPHQIIEQNETWSPAFQVLNNAGTFWYHPHGAGKTDLQVSRGMAGLIIVRDSSEVALDLPRNYGVDDFPVIVQTKAFDILYQIAISTNDDTTVCVNATRNAYLNAPAQVVRLRLLNAASMRVFNFGFSDNTPFAIIGTDGGLLDSSVILTRIMLAPGERAEILIDLQGREGESILLKSYSSEMNSNIYGADSVTGFMGGEIPDYYLNPLNGADFSVMQINIMAPTTDPVTEIPAALSGNTPPVDFEKERDFILQPDDTTDADASVEGPFNINGFHFNMDVVNEVVNINSTEKWHIMNKTGIAHPFHIHDVQFIIDNINGSSPPPYLQGRKDVVLIPAMQYVDLIMQFKDFADNEIPYMYHCHMLHHEDDGMMGSFTVIDTSLNALPEEHISGFLVSPNPVHGQIYINYQGTAEDPKLLNSFGELVPVEILIGQGVITVDMRFVQNGMYFLRLNLNESSPTIKIIKL